MVRAGQVFPQGYTTNAIVGFAVGLALVIFAVAWLVWTAALLPMPWFHVFIVFVLIFAILGLGGFLASWSLIVGRRKTPG